MIKIIKDSDIGQCKRLALIQIVIFLGRENMKTRQKVFFIAALLLIALTFVSCATQYDRTESINFGYYKDSYSESKTSQDGISISAMGLTETNANGGTFTFLSYQFPQYLTVNGERSKYSSDISHYCFRVLSGYAYKMRFLEDKLHLNLGLGVDLRTRAYYWQSSYYSEILLEESLGIGAIADFQYYFSEGFFLNASAVATADFLNYYASSSSNLSEFNTNLSVNLVGSIGLGIKFEGK